MVDEAVRGVSDIYSQFLASMPSEAATLINLFLLVLVIVVYVYFFIYKFYSFIGTKNVIGLDLAKYNTFEHPVTSKFIGALLYFVEYILILPFLVTFWFAVFVIFLAVLTEEGDMRHILSISAAIVGAVRIISFIPRGGGTAAREGAKFIPITLLGIAITTPGSFGFDNLLKQLGDLPHFFGMVPLYIGFLVGLEIILRFFEMIFVLTGLYSEEAIEKRPSEETETTEE